MLRVTDPSTGKSVEVRVTDRGPFGRGRIIDLSWRAAKELGILARGVAMVVVERVDETIVPFKPTTDYSLPELDFESTEDDGNSDGLHPAWREMKKSIK